MGIVYTVPNDKILVIETISTKTISNQGETVVQAGLSFLNNGIGDRVFMLPVFFQSCLSSIQCKYTVIQQVRLYAMLNDQIRLVIERFEVLSEGGNGSISFLGYLLPKDSPSLAP